MALVFWGDIAWGDDWDPVDDSISGATDLGIPGSEEGRQGFHTLSPEDESDWFRFYLDRGETYEFFSSLFADTFGELYQADGMTLIALNDDGSPNLDFVIRYTPVESGVYYLRVSQFMASDEIFYDLHYVNRSAAVDADAWDPVDDTLQGATDLGSPSEEEASHGLHSLSRLDQSDWFQVHLLEGTVYEFLATCGSDAACDLFRSNGVSRVATAEFDGNNSRFRIVYSPQESGTYFIRVQMQNPDLSGYYTLVYRISPYSLPIGDEWDPGDNIYDGATRLGTPEGEEQSHGPHILSATDRNDWFQFVLENGVTYEFSTEGSADTVGDLYSGDGITSLAMDDSGGEGRNFRIVFTAGETGKYFLRIREFSSSDATYVLFYRAIREPVVPVTDEWDPEDDTYNGASAFASDLFCHGPHTLSSVDLADWFRLDLQAGRTYELWTSGTSDTYGAVFADDGVSILMEEDDGGVSYNFYMQFTPVASGTYFVRVRMFDPGSSGAYMLNVLPSGPGASEPDAWDSGDDLLSGATLLESPSPLGGMHGPHTLSSNDTEDWFRIYLIAGMICEFSAHGNSDTVGTLYYWNDQNMVLHADTGGDEGNFRIQFTPENSGYYFLRVSEYSGGSAYYTLLFRGEASIKNTPSVNRTYRFDGLEDIAIFPGGFINAPGGTVRIGAIPVSGGYSDGMGAIIEVDPGEVLLLGFPTIDLGNNMALIRAAVRSTEGGAEVGLAALDGAMDGSIATNIPWESGLLRNEYQYRVLLYDPPGSSVSPVFQVANVNGTRAVSVYLDNLEIYVLSREESVSGWLFSADGISQDMEIHAATPIGFYPFENESEYAEYPGGYVGASGARVELGTIPTMEGHSDGQGVRFTANNADVSLIALSELEAGSDPVLIRVSVRSSGPGTAVALGALDNASQGGLSTIIPADSAIFADIYRRSVLLAQPLADRFSPLLQVAHREGDGETVVEMDSVEVFRLPSDALIPVKFLLGD